MASEVTEDPQAEVDAPPEEEKKPRGSLLASKKVKILALLALVMGVEAAGFYLLVPQGVGGQNTEKEVEPEDDVETVEVFVLKGYRTTNHNASAGVVTNVSFTIVAEVPANQSVEFDLAVNKGKAGLIKREIQTIIRGANSEEMHDPSLTVISQKIKEAINKSLRKSYVSRILLVNWNAIEQ